MLKTFSLWLYKRTHWREVHQARIRADRAHQNHVPSDTSYTLLLLNLLDD